MLRLPALQRLAIVAVATAVAVAGCGGSDNAASALPPASSVVALGDSLTYGTGASVETSYPSVLAQLSGWNVVNAGVPGETAAEGCARLPALVDAHRPRLVLVLLGGNDFLRRLPEDGIRDALGRCIATARARDTPIVLIPVPRYGFGGLANAEVYTTVAREHEVPLVEGDLAGLFGRVDMRADRVHLNEKGYRTMATTISDGLRKRGLLAR